MTQTKEDKARAKAVNENKAVMKKADEAAAKQAKADAKAAPKAQSVAAKAVATAAAVEADSGVLNGGAPSPVKPGDVVAVDAVASIETMSASELDAFEVSEALLVRHVPGVLGAIAARRDVLEGRSRVPAEGKRDVGRGR